MTATTLIKKYESAVKEKNNLKKRLSELEQNLELLADYTQEVKDIELARKQVSNGKITSQDKLFKKLSV